MSTNQATASKVAEISLITAFLICLFYGTASASTSLVNKYIFSIYKFKCVLLIFFLQQVFVLLIFTICKISPEGFLPKLFKIDDMKITFQMLWNIYILSFFTLLNVSTNIFALTIVNIPMFLALRRTSVFFILVLDAIVKKKLPKNGIIFSVVLNVIGAIIGGLSDIYFDIAGYSLILASNIFTAIQYQLQNFFGNDRKLNPMIILFMNALNMTPILLISCFIVGDFVILINFPQNSEAGFIISMIITSISGILVIYSQLLCNVYNSPMTTAITGNLKDVVLTVIGLFVFGDVEVNALLITGLSVSLIAAMVYSFFSIHYAKLAKEEEEKKKLLESNKEESDNLMENSKQNKENAEKVEKNDDENEKVKIN